MTDVVPGPERTAEGQPVEWNAPGTFARGTLGRQLLARVLVIVAAIAVLLSVTSTVAANYVLVNNVDRQLTSVVGRLQAGPHAPSADDLLQPGQPFGTLYAVVLDGDQSNPSSGLLTSTGSTRARQLTLSDPVISRLGEVPVDESPHTVRLPGLGRYRVIANRVQIVNTGQTGTLMVGVPLTDADRVLTWTIGVAGIVTVLALVGAGMAVQAVVRRSLRPLNRVATTAQQVSQLQLDRGEVALALRVSAADADPVSEVGRVGQAFNHMLDNVAGALVVRQTSETKLKQFIADASHELRNPLASIRGYAELTRRERDQVPANTAYALGRVEAEAERMSSLVEDLLLLARLDSGPAIDLAPVDVTELLVNAVSDARAAGPDHHWTLDLGPLGQGPFDLSPAGVGQSPATVLGDRNRLHQAVVNLLANARTHTPPGTSVTAGLRIQDGHVVIAISDNGPGIPADIQERVFERFTRGDDSRARSGDRTGGSTGLGLAIVAAVVEAHQGTVDVRSIPGDTRFELRLPLAAAATPT
ncbi:two-component sensor histidine kinase [Microlunatus endophyticus]|uniref:histidine kinase n=1 Tax=Microlunatus endophyticus TaxID=1716077 RepID=A0A917SAI2_9ACTN|nr:HAMP domain-containing sensor histidine kinase [Microlunatus endophyticus]GGL64980.1 two-component sensor histidine kinase [Microlunatus endophyticus]